jgi:tetratricopeptide (TPR) repeat protein
MTDRKWIWPLVLVSVFIFVLSLRQLSDPDLGFHLKYGKWIVTNHQVPVTDQSTYTVRDHAYVDLHWMFQVILYAVFTTTGYQGISLFVCILSLFLSLLLLLRQRSFGIPPFITSIALLIAFLIIDPRIAPRPEMFTFLFLTGILFILDLYAERKKNLLFLLPAIMLLWCNMHALFILGLVVLAVYFISTLVRERKPDRSLLKWMILSFLVCFINPYGIKGFALPLELLTRFNPNNIYNQHIQEFIPFFAQKHFFLRDYLFIIFFGIGSLSTFLKFSIRKLHEFVLLVLFGLLAIASIRNIPLFVLAAVPVISRQAFEFSSKFSLWRKELRFTLYMLMCLLPLVLIPQLLTNAYYLNNNSFNKTGMGINRSQLPEQAAAFLESNHLEGRMLNSIGFGGWLSWTLPQPVFMDGRLEVMQESVYREVTESWRGGLPALVNKYRPRLIIYNYLKYYPWTFQLKQMSRWRLIYYDGIAAIFASDTYALEIPALDLPVLPSPGNSASSITTNGWLQGLFRQTDYTVIDQVHQAMFRLQMTSTTANKNDEQQAAACFNSANLKYENGDIKGALADYDRAIMLKPSYSRAYNNRGILRASAFKDYPGAIADFGKAIEFDPGYAEAYLGRGTAYLLMRDVQSACSNWERAHSLGSVQATKLLELYCNRY